MEVQSNLQLLQPKLAVGLTLVAAALPAWLVICKETFDCAECSITKLKEGS